eukprot:12852364-Heterocapsa_arctica.AAC.1
MERRMRSGKARAAVMMARAAARTARAVKVEKMAKARARMVAKGASRPPTSTTSATPAAQE